MPCKFSSRQFIAQFIVFSLLLLPFSSWAADPYLELKHMDGRAASLDEYAGKGKWLLVMLWASDCHICNRDMPEVTEFYNKHKDKDAIVLGIALDAETNKAGVDEFLKKHAPTFDNVSVPLQQLALGYQTVTGEALRGTPTFMVYAPDGELIAINPGPMKIEALEEFIAKQPKEDA